MSVMHADMKKAPAVLVTVGVAGTPQPASDAVPPGKVTVATL